MVARTCLLVSAFFLAGSAARADDPTPEAVDAKGKPAGFKPGLSPRYAIWYDDAGWHFHTTTNTAAETEFTGRIDVVGGKMTLGFSGGPGSPVPKKKADPKKGAGDKKMETKGYNFKYTVNKGAVSYGSNLFHPDADVTALTFDLKINGKPADPSMIFIGAKGEHPKEATFTLAVKKAEKKK